jgi:hypothetical protein
MRLPLPVLARLLPALEIFDAEGTGAVLPR